LGKVLKALAPRSGSCVSPTQKACKLWSEYLSMFMWF
jgi:hypothetical protein